MHWSVYTKRIVMVVAALGVLTVGAMYLGGVICWGHESYEIRSVAPFGRSRVGASFGPKQIYLRAGETLVVRYDAEIRKGHLMLHLFKPFKPLGSKDSVSKNVYTTGKGEFTVRIRENCYYVLSIDAWPDGNGYDVAYDASWSRR